MVSFSCVVSFKKSPFSKASRIIWERHSVMHDRYESFLEYVISDVKNGYPKACDLQFTQPEYQKCEYSNIECAPNYWGQAGY